ncbi:MAG: helix-turn-helix transcriptional regulator [Selenomonas sp.]|nr:helix-turn-helix transcriptional regulator [Selenomonas sp.]
MDITACRLRELRKTKQMSQEDMAKYLGITRTAYNKYESGVIQPTRKLRELSALFGVSTDYLLGHEESSLEAQIRTMDQRAGNQLQKYLKLSESGKDIVDITLDAVYERESRPKDSE